MTTLVFYTSAICASINILLLLFVFPESLDKEMRMRNVEAAQEARIKPARERGGEVGALALYQERSERIRRAPGNARAESQDYMAEAGIGAFPLYLPPYLGSSSHS